MATIVDILDSLRAAIEAATPTEQVSEDDTFRTFTPTSTLRRGSRAILVQATPPAPVLPGRSCSEYRTTVTLTAVYAVSAPEEGQRAVYERALLDSETIAAALLLWAGTADAVTQVEQSEGDITDDGDGALEVERSLVVQYIRS